MDHTTVEYRILKKKPQASRAKIEGRVWHGRKFQFWWGFSEVGGKRGRFENKSLSKKIPLFYKTINPEKMKHFTLQIKKNIFFCERLPLKKVS